MVIQSHEIGSEFWDIPVLSSDKTNIFPKQTQWFLSGRVALEYIICDIKARFSVSTVAMPSWCCDSMIIPFVKNGIDVVFYTFDDSENIPECDILFCMEHFGYIRHKSIIDFRGIVIHDVTHSMFSENFGMKNVKGAKSQYFFGSLRKWAGFKTGGFAGVIDGKFTVSMPKLTNEEYVEIRTRAMTEKAKYLTDENGSKEYLGLFSKAEDMLEKSEIASADEADIISAMRLDVDFIRKRRRKNAQKLLEVVFDIAIYPEIRPDDCPLFVPVRLPNEKRNALRKYLIEHSVFCPVHWPLTKWHDISDKQKKIYNEELSLVCDQRYTLSDMQYICQLINNF